MPGELALAPLQKGSFECCAVDRDVCQRYLNRYAYPVCLYGVSSENKNNGDNFYRRKVMRAANDKLTINELGPNYDGSPTLADKQATKQKLNPEAASSAVACSWTMHASQVGYNNDSVTAQFRIGQKCCANCWTINYTS